MKKVRNKYCTNIILSNSRVSSGVSLEVLVNIISYGFLDPMKVAKLGVATESFPQI